jgi:hypothetical protein
VGLTPTKPASESVSGEVKDEPEKLRSNVVHACDRRKPLTRRIIEAVKDRVPRKTRERETKKKEDAANNRQTKT